MTKKQDPRKFSHERFTALVQETILSIDNLQQLKGGEYAGDEDRLANFRRNAFNLNTYQELVWAVYAGKHWDALMQYVQDIGEGKERVRLESLAGRCDDLIVYCILFKAMLAESPQHSVTEEAREMTAGESNGDEQTSLLVAEGKPSNGGDPRMKLSLKEVGEALAPKSGPKNMGASPIAYPEGGVR